MIPETIQNEDSPKGRVLICYDNAIGKIPLLLYVLNADELVGDGVDDEAGGAVYLQLLRYIAAVGGYGVHREAEGASSPSSPY